MFRTAFTVVANRALVLGALFLLLSSYARTSCPYNESLAGHVEDALGGFRTIADVLK